MIELASFAEHRVALAFSDYLKAQGIDNRIEVEPDRFGIFLANPGQLERARQELDEFLDNPEDNKYWPSPWPNGKADVPPPAAGGEDVASVLKRMWQRSGGLTLLVMAACILAFIVFHGQPEQVFSLLKFPDDLNRLHHEPWRLLTPVLLHFGIMHLVFNLLCWWELGGMVERTQSRLQLLGLFMVTAMVSNVWQYRDSGSGFGGLSGVVYGLLGYLWVYPQFNPAAGFRLGREIFLFLTGWLLVGYSGLLDNLLGKMANAAHASGLLAGMVLGMLFGLLHRPKGSNV